MQFQRALHNPSRGSVSSSKTIAIKFFFKTYKLLTTRAHLALARLHTLRGKGHVWCIGGSTDPVFTKWSCKESQTNLTKKGEQRCRTIFVSHPTLPFWTKIHRKRTNYVWPFQFDYVMHEVEDVHHRASARWAFVVVKVYTFYFFLENDWLLH